MKDKIIEYIKSNFFNLSTIPSIKEIEFIEKTIDEYHQKQECFDEDLVIYESLLLLIPPLVDYVKALDLLNKVSSTKTLILKATIQYENMGLINDDVIIELKKEITSNISNIEKSVIGYLLSLSDTIVKEKKGFLINSIKCNPKNVNSFIELGNFYIKQNNIKEGINYLEEGLKNVEWIIKQDTPVNIVEYDFFIKETLIGNYMSIELYEYWKDLIKIEKNRC